MTRRQQPLTRLSAILTVAGAGCTLADLPWAQAVCLSAHVCALAEFKKYTGRFQFVMIVVSAAVLGLSIDMASGSDVKATIPLLMSACAIVLRQAYMPVFTYVNKLWLEPLLLVCAAVPLSLAFVRVPFAWTTHVFPLATFSGASFLAGSYLQDAVMMRRRTRNGYRVQPGMMAPDFILADQEGVPVRLSDHFGRHPVLLVFVRGDWCPGCHMMLRTYEKHNERFKAHGVHVVAIGPDRVEVNRDMVRRIGVGYQLLSDSAQEVSRRYGVVYENPAIETVVDYAEGIPLPASFLVDENGMVRYVSRPDRVGEFLDPALIFNVLDRLPGAGTGENGRSLDRAA